MSGIKVLYVEDDPDWREGIQTFLSNYSDIELVATVPTIAACKAQLETHLVDIIIMDIVLGDYEVSGLDGTLDITLQYPHIKIIMLSSMEKHDELFNEAFLNGAYDYVYKSEFDQLPNIIDTAMKNATSKYGERLKKLVYAQKKRLLSEGDIMMLTMLLQDKTQTEIARELNVSLAAVKKQVGRVKKKFNWQQSSKELASKCYKWGLLDS